MRIYKLNKAVLVFKNNAAHFFQGLAANTADAPQSAFLNIHGKIVATFEQLKISDEEMLITIERPFLQEVLNHVDRYVRLSGVKIEQLDKHAYFDLDNDVGVEGGDYRIPHKQGRIIITSRELASNITLEEFNLFRLYNDIPVHGLDYRDEFLLNINETDFVSFTKGCFLGQEPVSKVHNRSKPSWKLAVRYELDCSDEEKLKMTSKTFDPVTRKTLGFVFVSNRE